MKAACSNQEHIVYLRRYTCAVCFLITHACTHTHTSLSILALSAVDIIAGLTVLMKEQGSN